MRSIGVILLVLPLLVPGCVVAYAQAESLDASGGVAWIVQMLATGGPLVGALLWLIRWITVGRPMRLLLELGDRQLLLELRRTSEPGSV